MRRVIVIAVFFALIGTTVPAFAEDSSREELLKAAGETISEIEKDPSDVGARLQLADIYHSLILLSEGDEAAAFLHKAMEQIRAVRETGKEQRLVQTIEYQLQERAFGVRRPSADAMGEFIKAEQAFAKKDYDEALKRYDKAIEADPSCGTLYLYKGDAYFAKKEYVKAIALYDKALEINPLDFRAYRFKADLYRKTGEIDPAMEYLVKAVICNPNYRFGWTDIGRMAKALNVKILANAVKPKASIETAGGKRNIIMQETDSVEEKAVWLIYAAALVEWSTIKFQKVFPQAEEYRPTFAEAIYAWDKTLKAYEDIRKESNYRHEGLERLLKMREAGFLEAHIFMECFREEYAQEYRTWREENPGKMERYVWTYLMEAADKEKPSWVNEWAAREIVAACETDETALRQLAEKSQSQEGTPEQHETARKAYEAALKDMTELLEQAVNYDDDNSCAHYMLAECLTLAGDYSRALAHMLRADEIGKCGGTPDLMLGRIYERLAHEEKGEKQTEYYNNALESYKRFLQAHPDSTSAPEVEAAIKRIQGATKATP